MSFRGKSRSTNSKGFQSSGLSSFGGFSTASSSLSYISEPPDFTPISDPNVVVSLKNLLKKDSTTKAKALDDFLVYIKEHPYEKDGGVEEPVLDAWVKLYPRTSIDNSRRVRELAHVVQLELMKSARKRMEKRIPKLAGSWLAGTFDKDRVVSRAATTGLSSFLSTEEKVANFWRKLQGQIIDYALETVRETPDTLSDERSTTKDDAEAKYYRVVGAALSLALTLIQRVGVDEVRAQFDQFLGADSVWALAAAEDSWVRKCVYQLAQVCLQKQPELFKSNLSQAGRALVSDAFKVKQTGSATDFVRVLAAISKSHPEVWGTKKQPLSRLQSFVEKGSQGCSAEFWKELYQLIAVVSQSSVSVEVAAGFLKALRAGLSGREEPRLYGPVSWGCYLDTFVLLLGKLSPETSCPDFLTDGFYPTTQQYLHPVSERASWNVADPLNLLPRTWVAVASHKEEATRQSVEQEWLRLAESFTSRMANSLPEVSKDFESSQQGVADEGDRWFRMIGVLLRQVCDADTDAELATYLKGILFKASNKVIQESLDLLRKRNFKPFGAAAVIASAAKHWLPFLENDTNSVITSLFSIDRSEELETILASPSAPLLLSCLNSYGGIPQYSSQYSSIWTIIINSLLQNEGGGSDKVDRVTTLITPPAASPLAQRHEPLQEYLITNCLKAVEGTPKESNLLEVALKHNALTDNSKQRLATGIVAILGSLGNSTPAALKSLELILRHHAEGFQDKDFNVQLITRLLELTEISDKSVSERVPIILSLLDQSTKFGQSTSATSIVHVLQENLDSAGQRSLRIETLVEQARSVIAAKKDNSALRETLKIPVEDVFPNTNVWMEELSMFMQNAPDPSLSLSSSLGGTYYLVQGTAAPSDWVPRRDRHGISIPARMALYSTNLLSSGVDLSSLPQKLQAELLYCLYLVVELAEDQLIAVTTPKNLRLWTDVSSGISGSHLNGEVEKFVSSARMLLRDIAGQMSPWNVGSKGDLEGTMVGEGPGADLLTILLQQAKGLSPLALYSAKALADVLEYFAAAQEVRSVSKSTSTTLNVWRATTDTLFTAVALMAGFGDRLHGPGEHLDESSVIGLLCNRLVSDITGATPGQSALMALTLLNSCFNVFGVSRKLPVNERRQIFAVKQITSWMGAPEKVDSRLSAELCKALQTFYRAVPSGQDSEVVIDYCIAMWENEQLAGDLPCLHASLKLMVAMESLPDRFPDRNNEDLVDALKTYAEAKSQALINLLKLRGDASGVSDNQAAGMVDDLLCRCVAKIPLEHIQDLPELYGYVASKSKQIQTAAFRLLHKALPAAISQVNVDVLLEKRDAQLPDELLSLLLGAPEYDAYSDDVLAQFPSAIRSYLLSWLLVFDAFEAASLKVRSDYVESLKGNNCLDSLLKFMFDVLGHSDATPLNLERSKFDDDHIRSYTLEEAEIETPERDLQWLLIHLFYRTLKYVPGLFKTWFLNCSSKQTKLAVEPWMTKFFSPLIIDEHLMDVKKWAESQEPPAEDEKELKVSIWNKGREVFAAYEVDEQDAAICIRVPEGFPLESVTVTTKNRVAISEMQWQSWLLTIQGVITLWHGSIIDGLTAFRSNMVGQLKGQTECAICYSIISTDNKMPDKRCGTCKNLFHRVCLYKWFQTSSQNTCPLCRNPIDYLGSSGQGRGGRPE